MDPPEIRKVIRIWPTIELNEKTAEKEFILQPLFKEH